MKSNDLIYLYISRSECHNLPWFNMKQLLTVSGASGLICMEYVLFKVLFAEQLCYLEQKLTPKMGLCCLCDSLCYCLI